MGNVRVIKPFLNLLEGTELWFNEKSGRYEFKSRDEDSSADYKTIHECSISLEPWLVEQNIGKYFSEIQIEKNMAEPGLPADEVEPMEEPVEQCWEPAELTHDLMIAKINADSAERIAQIQAESNERIARIHNSEPKDWGVHSDGFQGGF